jgi:hypothetical protein
VLFVVPNNTVGQIGYFWHVHRPAITPGARP